LVPPHIPTHTHWVGRSHALVDSGRDPLLATELQAGGAMLAGYKIFLRLPFRRSMYPIGHWAPSSSPKVRSPPLTVVTRDVVTRTY